jgi:hypothetical protein
MGREALLAFARVHARGGQADAPDVTAPAYDAAW